ncbi:MAG: phosphoribosylanthranilate isomerase [Pseudomonadota bacterium]
MSLEIKICGINSRDALESAIAAGADMVGFVSFPKSPRHLEHLPMRDLAEAARGRVRRVLLSVDASNEDLRTLIAAVQPDLLQLHGHETPERVVQVRTFSGLPVMKAIPIRTRDDLARVADFAAVSDRLLFDAKPDPGDQLPGGNGRTFDWDLLRALDPGRPIMLSGGLDPDNVPQALARIRVAGVDVSSGVETAPGVKSAEKIAAFVRAARSAERDVAS